MAPDERQVLWTEADAFRLQRDVDEFATFAPDLTYVPPGELSSLHHGGWTGALPVWPFDREPPVGLDELVPTGLEIVLEYHAAYPMVAPNIHPLRPEPTLVERTQSAWHVLPSGALCLFQSDGGWLPEASLTELLLKAAGWRVEYALMKAGVIDAMSVTGIVSDGVYDRLVTAAVRKDER